MILHHWKIYRLMIIGGIIACFVWLVYWVMPTLSFFSLAFSKPPITENGVSIVFFKEWKSTNAYSLSNYTLGWGVVKETWPLILLGIIIGYPFGEFVIWRIGVEKISGKIYENYKRLSRNLSDRERRIEFIIQENNDQLCELTELKKEAKQLRGELYDTKCFAGEQKKSYEAMQHKIKSLEKELSKAKAKIRRLTTQKKGSRKTG